MKGDKMKKIIARKIDMEELPLNCFDCNEAGCRLGIMKNKEMLLKKCKTQRHKDCPLIEINANIPL